MLTAEAAFIHCYKHVF